MHYEKFTDGTVKCIEDEIPFDVPDGWAWSRLGSICIDVLYGLNNSAESSGTHKLLRITDIQDGKVNWSSVPFTTIENKDDYILKNGDIVFARTGATVGKSFLINNVPINSVYASYLIRIRLNNAFDSEYIYHFFNSGCYWAQITDKSVGVGQPNCNGTSLRELFVPIPPASQQPTIAAFSNRLLSTSYVIENKQASVNNLITQCKSKILDLAIRGKLVPQNPDDEPASVLLERIRAEKEELIKQGEIKRDKNESVIFKGEDNSYYIRFGKRQESVEERLLFELPERWQFGTLYQVASIDLGKTLDKSKNTGNYFPYLRSVNVRWNSIDLSDVKKMKFEKNELEKYSVQKNDLLICEGGDVGRCCVWNEEYSIQYQNALHRVRLYQSCNPAYFMYYLMYYESHNMLKQMCAGVTIKHLTGNVLSKIPFAIPPIDEQARVVKAVDESFAFLDSIAKLLL